MTEKETIKRPEITKEWLKENGACSSGTAWFNDQKETDAKKVLRSLLNQNHFDWANWTIVRLMTHQQKIKYAIYSAEKVLSVYESKYPENKAPHNAIKAAKACLKNPSEGNRAAAYAAAYAAAATRAAADAATRAVAYAAAYAAYAAADAADAAAYAAAYAAYAAAYAADAAARAADAMKKQIIEYGIKLIGESK